MTAASKRARGLVLLLGLPAGIALSIAYRVELRNDLSSTVSVELRQYWLLEDEVVRPSSWTAEHLVRSVTGQLVPGEEDETEFEGGGWVVWQVTDYGTGRVRCQGEIDFETGAHHRRVAIGRDNCLKIE